MNIGIIGSGLQCGRRIEALQNSNLDQIVLVVGNNLKSLETVSKKYNVQISQTIDEIFSTDEIEVIIICTPPNSHYEYMRRALLAGKNVLVEKPISKTSMEIEHLLEEFGDEVNERIRCGFNHRFHPGLQMAKKYISDMAIGDILFARSTYGIAARPAYTDEWRSNPEYAAGGQFIEQGSHQIDLLRWLIGPVKSIFCKTTNKIFENQPLDDGGMAILTFDHGVTAQIHTTLAQWHNKFEFEIYGTNGFIRVSGLGNAYGTETFEFAKRDDSAPFNSHTHQFRGADKSWSLEWDAFKNAMAGLATDIGSINDAYEVMRIAEAGYISNETLSEVLID